MSEQTAAQFLDVSPSMFRKRVRPEVPFVRLGPKTIRWLREDLERWVARGLDPDAALTEGNPWDRT